MKLVDLDAKHPYLLDGRYYVGTQNDKWTPCSERLPEENGRYLCTYAEMQGCEYISCIDFGSFINGEWYVSGVIAWMPMPKIYKEDADD